MAAPGRSFLGPAGVTEEQLVIDASALVDLVLGEAVGAAVQERVCGAALHAPAHLHAEVLSALGRLHRSGRLTTAVVGAQLAAISSAPIQRHSLPDLLRGAWRRRNRMRLADALYVELADQLGLRLLTTDRALARAASIAEVVSAAGA